MIRFTISKLNIIKMLEGKLDLGKAEPCSEEWSPSLKLWKTKRGS